MAIAYFAPQLAPSLLSALGTSTATALATTIATTVIGAALSIAASLALGAIAGGGSKPATQSGPTASPGIFRQSISSSFIIYGKRRVGGLLTFFHPVGSEFRYFVIACAGHRCKGVTRWFLGDDVVTVDGSGMVTSGTYAGNAWLWFARGTDDQAANATFVAETQGKWTTNHRGRGTAMIYAKFRMVDAVVQAGMPNITAEVEGKDDILDPRTGTRGYTRNAALVFYDFMAMPREEGGFGCYDDEIDWDWVSAQANVCDEDIPLAAGGTEKRYEFDSYIQTGSAPSEVRDTFITCCAGMFTYSDGKMLMRPGYYVPPSVTLHERDLAGAISVPAMLASDQVSNEVTGTYIDPTSLYQAKDAPSRSIAGDDVRQLPVDMPHITSVTRAQRIMEYYLRKANAERRVTWPMNIMGIGVATLDTVQIATARYGLSNYSFQVTGWSLSQDFSVNLVLEEHSPELFEWTPAMETTVTAGGFLVQAQPIKDAVRPDIASSFPIGLSIMANADGSVTINDHTRRYTDGHADVLVKGSTITTGLAAGDFRAIYYDDPNRNGGVVTYGLDADDINARVSPANPGRHYVGYFIIPTAGSPPASGGGANPPGGYCVTVDTEILMDGGATKMAGDVAVGDKLWTRHEASLAWGTYPVEAIQIVDSDDVWEATIGGKLLRATGDHLVYTGEWVPMREIGIQTDPARVVKMTVTSAHTYVSNGILSHNIKADRVNNE